MDGFSADIRRADGLAIFLDVDGTLIEFAARPDAVRVPAGLAHILTAASRRLGGALALTSGRSIADLDCLLAPALLPASGIHGGETRLDPNGPVHRIAKELLRADLSRITQAASRFPGAFVEDKAYSVAIHFRDNPGIAPSLRQSLAGLVPAGLQMVQGELVFEIKQAGFDKGTALRRFMQVAPFASRRPVFVSDHPIDRPGFDAAAALGGFGISVGQHVAGALGCLANPEAVRAWLADLAA